MDPSRGAMRAFILSVGDELVSGLAVDTNSAWLSRELGAEGVLTIGHATVGDRPGRAHPAETGRID